MDVSVPILLKGEKIGNALWSKGGDHWVTTEDGPQKEPFLRDISNKGAEWLGFNVSTYIADRLKQEPLPEHIELMDGMTEAGREKNRDVVEVFLEHPGFLDSTPFVEEVRSVSKTGAEKGVKPERYSLIPKPPLDLLGKVYGFGERKYAAHNYRKGYEWSKSYDALQRHLAAWWEREDNDPESGLSHLGHAAFHIFALICFSSDKRYAEFDDRYIPGEI